MRGKLLLVARVKVKCPLRKTIPEKTITKESSSIPLIQVVITQNFRSSVFMKILLNI